MVKHELHVQDVYPLNSDSGGGPAFCLKVFSTSPSVISGKREGLRGLSGDRRRGQVASSPSGICGDPPLMPRGGPCKHALSSSKELYVLLLRANGKRFTQEESFKGIKSD